MGKPYCEVSKFIKPDPTVNYDVSGCETWFDGCNTCEVFSDLSMSCTDKVCKVLQKPYCAFTT